MPSVSVSEYRPPLNLGGPANDGMAGSTGVPETVRNGEPGNRGPGAALNWGTGVPASRRWDEPATQRAGETESSPQNTMLRRSADSPIRRFADSPLRRFGLLLALLAFGAMPARASTSNGTGGGNWSSAATWSPAAVPTSTDSVTIVAGDTVTVDITTATASTTTVRGTLAFSTVNSSTFTLVQGSMTVAAGGTLTLGTAATPIPAGSTATLVLAYGGTAGQYGLTISNGGNFVVYGTTKTPYTTATADASAGATSVSVNTPITGWSNGDLITIDTEAVTITSISGGNVSFTPALTLNHSSTSPVTVANLSRNAVVRSSGTCTGSGCSPGNTAYVQDLARNATSFSLTYGEFAYLGSTLAGKYGLEWDGSAVKGSISSSTVRDGYNGIYLNSAGGNTFDQNVVYKMATTAIHLSNASANTLSGNRVLKSASSGIYLTGSLNNTLSGNTVSGHSSYALYFTGGSNNNTVSGNTVTGNVSMGIYLNGANNNVLIGNQVSGNQDRGIYLSAAVNTTLVESRLGYDAAGTPHANGTAEILFDAGNPASLVMKNTRVNPSPGINLTGFNRVDNYLVSYHQDFDTGTVRIYGDYAVSGSTLSLDYASRLYVSTATTPKVMRQVGTAATFTVNSTSDTTAVTQLITMTWDGSAWQVVGSSSGNMGAYNTSDVSKPFPSSGPTQFMLKITYTTPASGDSADFVLMAASQDTEFQKQLRFGKAASASSTWNGNTGRSRLRVAPGAGFSAVGVSTAPTIIDWLDSSSTFYTFVSSGTFRLVYSSVTRADEKGLWLSGTGGVTMSSSVFDFAGTGGGSSTSTYISAISLTSNATFYGMTFMNSWSSAPYANYNVWASTETNLAWYFTGWSGTRGGSCSEREDPGLDKVTWSANSGLGSGTLYTWRGTANNNWSNASNWNPSLACGYSGPGASDSALIVTTATVMPILTQDVTISSLTINSGTATVTLDGYHLTLSSFTNAGNFYLKGSERVSTPPNNLVGSSVTYNGITSTLPLLSTWTYRNLHVNGSGGTFSATGGLTIKENLTLSAGTLDMTTSSYSITISSNWAASGGAFTARGSSVTFNGTHQSLTGSTTFFDLVKIATSPYTLTLPANSTQTVLGTLTLQGSSVTTRLSLRSSIPSTQAYLALSTSGVQSLGYLDVQDNNASGGQTLYCTTNNQGCADSGNNTNWVIVPMSDIPNDQAWATDGSVFAILRDGTTTYIGGNFTRVGPNTGNGVPISETTGLPVSPYPKVAGTINAAVPDGSGGWYIGGTFTHVGGVARNRIAHILPSGQVDPAWNPNANNTVQALAVSGGVVYAGGSFTTIGGQSRSLLAALDSSGSGAATSWNPSPSGTSATIEALAVSGGLVYAGGRFTTIGGQSRNRIAALNASGTGTATSWTAGNVNGNVFALAVSGGVVYAGGAFTTIGGQTRNKIAALDASGNATSWNPNADNNVNALALSGGVVYAGGEFGTIGGQTRDAIAALDASGNATSWTAGAVSANVFALAVSGGVVYAGGNFTAIGGQTRSSIAALDTATGNVTSWNPIANNYVYALAASGGLVYAGGSFTMIGGQTRNRIAALDASGNVTSWNPNASSSVESLAVSGGVVYAGGYFTTIGGQTRFYIAALDSSGNATPWNPMADSTVAGLAVSGGLVYAGGQFTWIGGQDRNFIAALDASGNATSWNPNASDSVRALALSGGVVYAGGDFTTIGGQARNFLAALDASGNATSWNAGNVNNSVNALAVSGGVVYAGGDFDTIGGQTRNNIAALDSSGNATTWNPDATPTSRDVRSLFVSGGLVYAGGTFTTIGGQSRNYIAALDANGIASAWNPSANGSVRALVVSGGTAYVGGDFTAISGRPAVGFAMISVPGITGTAYADTGTTPLGSGRTVALSVNGAAPAYTATINASGQFTFSGLNLTAGTTIALYLSGASEKAVTAVLASAESNAQIDLYQDHLIVRSDLTDGTPATNALLAAANNGNADMTAIYSVAGTALTTASGKSLYVWGGTSYQPKGQITTNNNLVIAGALQPQGSSVTVNGLWRQTGVVQLGTSVVTLNGGGIDLTGSGNFDAGTSTVIFKGASVQQSTSAGKSFFHVEVNGAGLTLMDNFQAGGNLALTAGTLDPSASNYSVTVSSSWLNTGGVFTARASTVTLAGARVGLSMKSKGYPFSNLQLSGTGYYTLVDSMTVTSTMTLTAGTLDAFHLQFRHLAGRELVQHDQHLYGEVFNRYAGRHLRRPAASDQRQTLRLPALKRLRRLLHARGFHDGHLHHDAHGRNIEHKCERQLRHCGRGRLGGQRRGVRAEPERGDLERHQPVPDGFDHVLRFSQDRHLTLHLDAAGELHADGLGDAHPARVFGHDALVLALERAEHASLPCSVYLWCPEPRLFRRQRQQRLGRPDANLHHEQPRLRGFRQQRQLGDCPDVGRPEQPGLDDQR